MSYTPKGSFLFVPKKYVRLTKKKREEITDTIRYIAQLHFTFFGKGQALISTFKIQYLIIP